MARLLVILVSGLLIALARVPDRVVADGSWLDVRPPMQWNTPGMAIPQAPPRPQGVDPRCFDALVVPDTVGKQALVTAGWFLLNAQSVTQGVEIVSGQSSADGMCRPMGYQTFVFVNGTFAGTLSPDLMHSRTDGALTQTSVLSSSQIQAEYVRYTDRDPLCCPSARSTATFDITRVGGAPVVRPGSVSTVPTGAPTPPPTPVPPPSSPPVPAPVQAPVQLPRGQ